ncbi:UDP-glucosyl transferase family protein [Mucor ambiguus]|uniref:UDP-glucosyl transferase family protein n=1 Tax=Mucor ambiguus TaxID=91626 RepID=A0A0C9MR19_9FUNG|nr:UDP-glucosyl transferase family protein [Mucor ambiguus]
MIKYIKNAVLLLAASLILQQASVGAAELEPTFQQKHASKNIAFFAPFGGASHMNWVLSIGNELGMRGHNITFLTVDEFTKLGRSSPYVNTMSVGQGVDVSGTAQYTKDLKGTTIDTIKFMGKGFEYMYANFERDFKAAKEFFESNNIDLAICDHFSDACYTAADLLHIPYVVTSTLSITNDGGATYINNKLTTMTDFTTEFQPFATRFVGKFFVPMMELYYLLPTLNQVTDRKRALGIPAKMQEPSETWKNSLKLINSLNGFSAPRPLGPLVEYVGPIISKTYQPLTEDLKEYLDSHERVAYVAFGQMATPVEKDIYLILSGLLESIEQGRLDGFLWASVHAAGYFPDTITTSSNTTYNVQDMFNQRNPHARVIKWAPQTAVLQHPSTRLFVSHGGLGSWYESMYSGTRMVMFPFFGDQPGNALLIERGKLGGILKNDFTVPQAVELLRRILDDEDGEIAKNVDKYQALVQIHSRHGVAKGADLIEEVAYTHEDGLLKHRQSADQRMGYVKSHDLDLYGALLVVVGLGLWFTTAIVKHVALHLKSTSTEKTQYYRQHIHD